MPKYRVELTVVDENGVGYTERADLIEADNEKAAEGIAIESWWDPRLSSASCAPVVDVQPWPASVDEVLKLIEEEYGTLDDAWTVAPDVRAHTDHTETGGSRNRCTVCGDLDVDPETALKAGINPLMHPEVYGG